MADSGVQPNLLDGLARSISVERLSTYLKATGHDHERALRLYLWNVEVGQAFHLPIQSVEVALRNCVNTGLSMRYTSSWWTDSSFRTLAGRERVCDIETALKRLRNRKITPNNGQMVATLSFGFWVGTMQASFNPDIWSRVLRDAFPCLPANVTRGSIADASKRVSELRNRIWHHEPIIHKDILAEFSGMIELLTWLCPTKAAWIRPLCTIPTIVRRKP